MPPCARPLLLSTDVDAKVASAAPARHTAAVSPGQMPCAATSSASRPDGRPPTFRRRRSVRWATLKGHHGRGVHGADEDPGEPVGRIGEVSPIIGKVSRTPGHWHFATGLALRVGVRKTSTICGSPSPGVDISSGAGSLSVKLITPPASGQVRGSELSASDRVDER